MNILFITHYSAMYGANRSMLQLILELREKGNIKPVVLLRNHGDICIWLEKENIPYIITHFYWWVNEDKGLYKKILNIRKQLVNYYRIHKIIALIKPYAIDLIYSNSITINIGALIKDKLKIPHIWHLRESLESFNFKLSLGKLCSKHFLETAADKYILISNYLCESYKDLIPQERICRIYNGIDFAKTPIRENSFKETLNLCMVGIISEQKNQLDAIKAIQILNNHYGQKQIRLHLIGGAKEDYVSLTQNYVRNNHLDEFVIFHGHQENIHEILQKMNLGLMCSRDEAFGRVTVEYMLHTMPVIASIAGANQEVVKAGVSGYLYPLGNVEELAKNIYHFIENPEVLTSMGKTAYEDAKANFSSEQNTNAIYEIITSLIKKNN